jgi:hypothetical protein
MLRPLGELPSFERNKIRELKKKISLFSSGKQKDLTQRTLSKLNRTTS